MLSPPGAKGNLIYDGTIRSVRDTPASIVKKIGSQAKLVELTLPKGGLGSAQGSAWFSVEGIGRVTEEARGSLLKMKGQRGTVQVVETVDRVKELIAAAN